MSETVVSTRSILCVEDDDDSRELLRFVFRDFDVTCVRTVSEANEQIEMQKFDLYILDNWLPDGSGIELCAAIRSANPDVPIVFMSASGRPNDMREAEAAGASRYFVKPCDPEVVRAAIGLLLSSPTV